MLWCTLMTILRGGSETGIGDYGRWIKTLTALYPSKIGLGLFPGTVYVVCDEEWPVPPDCIRLAEHEYGGAVSVSIVPCKILGRCAFILRTDTNEHGTGNHSRRVFEVATDIKLRDTFNLQDGDIVEIEIPHA